MEAQVHDAGTGRSGPGEDPVRDRRQESFRVTGRYDLSGRVITIGVTSGIACYKAVDLMRDLQRAGARVRVVLTDSAAELVRPALFEALGGEPVGRSLWNQPSADRSPGEYERFPHLDFARGIDAVIVAPATANTLGKATAGIGDDLLSTMLLAVDPSRVPVLFVPTMNATMYEHPAVVSNRSVLRERGYWLLAPGEGELACGEIGMGRWPGNEAILAAVDRAVNGGGRLSGKRVLVTAGRTEADLDPARTLTNRSTGRMGFAIARAAWRHGANVTLVHGPTELDSPPFVETVAVRTVGEMSRAVREALPGVAQVWMAAAVGDWAPAEPSEVKLKKDEWDGRLALERTEDILARIGVEKDDETVVVGFAVETDDVEARAREKLDRKGCDFMVVNNPLEEGAAFGHDTNRVTLLGRDGSTDALDLMSKDQIAEALMRRVLEHSAASSVLEG